MNVETKITKALKTDTTIQIEISGTYEEIISLRRQLEYCKNRDLPRASEVISHLRSIIGQYEIHAEQMIRT